MTREAPREGAVLHKCATYDTEHSSKLLNVTQQVNGKGGHGK